MEIYVQEISSLQFSHRLFRPSLLLICSLLDGFADVCLCCLLVFPLVSLAVKLWMGTVVGKPLASLHSETLADASAKRIWHPGVEHLYSNQFRVAHVYKQIRRDGQNLVTTQMMTAGVGQLGTPIDVDYQKITCKWNTHIVYV